MVKLSNGYKLFTQQWLKGDKNLLLIPGGPGLTYNIFENFKDHLKNENITITVFDPLGGYYSDDPDPDFENDMDYYVDEVEEVRQKLQLDNLIILGHSWGGVILQKYLVRYPGKAKAAILVNSFYSISKYEQNTDVLRKKLPKKVQRKLFEFIESKNFGEEFQRFLVQEWHNRHFCTLKPWPKPLVDSLNKIAVDLSLKFLGPNPFNFTGEITQWEFRDQLANIKAPVLAISGKDDINFKEDMEVFKNEIPECKIFISPKSSHTPMWEDEKGFFSRVKGFINSESNIY